jgi:preprotein translocase subunit SecA
MDRLQIPVPGLMWGDYPERRPERRDWRQRCQAVICEGVDRLADAADVWRRRRDRAWLADVRRASRDLAELEPAAARLQVRSRLMQDGLAPDAVSLALGLACLATQRSLGLEPFDTQLLAARIVLDNGLAEMATGEGKTLAVALAASVAALARMPVQVITANDYLVARDADKLRPLARWLELSVACVVQGDEPPKRLEAYRADICFVTATELVFDYLRDSLGARTGSRTARRDAPPAALARLGDDATPPALLRGLCMAIVDEADAVLIDEARVPLILSQPADDGEAEAHARDALAFSRTLVESRDYRLDAPSMQARLTQAGRDRLEAAADALATASASPAWRNRRHREHAITMALAADHLFLRERQYLVREGKLEIVDETTGRVAEGRVWSQGLQQLIEIKEGLEPSPSMATVAQLTYQRFFPRYLRLGGLSGTLMEARSELMSTYGLSVRRIPLRRPGRRVELPTRLFADRDTLARSVAARCAELQRRGQPVLVAADSVADAEHLAAALRAAGLSPRHLTASNPADEADTVSRAGLKGALTVTTNMAGRGTDILLGEGVAALGGLHVLSCQLNSARRIDRQLAGRAARQGDPGSVESWVSLDTRLLADRMPLALRRVLARACGRWPSWAVRALLRWPQRVEEARQRVQRQRLIEQDERMQRQLGFVGPAD